VDDRNVVRMHGGRTLKKDERRQWLIVRGRLIEAHVVWIGHGPGGVRFVAAP
jgi:hypothetical protein